MKNYKIRLAFDLKLKILLITNVVVLLHSLGVCNNDTIRCGYMNLFKLK